MVDCLSGATGIYVSRLSRSWRNSVFILVKIDCRPVDQSRSVPRPLHCQAKIIMVRVAVKQWLSCSLTNSILNLIRSDAVVSGEVSLSTLLRLLMELLLMIMKNLNIRNCFALGLTCQHLWHSAVYVIHSTESQSSWVGKSIVCLNHHLKPGDLPWVVKRRTDAQVEHNFILNHNSISSCTLICRNYNLVSANCGLRYWLLRQADKDRWFDTTRISRDLQQTILQNSDQVLQNLIQKLFVQGDHLPLEVGLGHVILI